VIRRLLRFIEAPSRLRYALGEIEYLRARISEVTAERDRWRARATALRLEVEQLREPPCE
jgi:predicted secreted protein